MQYIQWNKRLYIHGVAVKRQDIFIWFITLFHLIHEQLASWDRSERGRLVLSSLTLYSMALVKGKRKRERERGREREWALNGDAFTMGTTNIKVYLLDTTKTYLSAIIHWPVNTKCRKRGIKLKWSWDWVLSQDALYDKLYIMLIPAW